jgi:hypothetical protein
MGSQLLMLKASVCKRQTYQALSAGVVLGNPVAPIIAYITDGDCALPVWGKADIPELPIKSGLARSFCEQFDRSMAFASDMSPKSWPHPGCTGPAGTLHYLLASRRVGECAQAFALKICNRIGRGIGISSPILTSAFA